MFASSWPMRFWKAISWQIRERICLSLCCFTTSVWLTLTIGVKYSCSWRKSTCFRLWIWRDMATVTSEHFSKRSSKKTDSMNQLFKSFSPFYQSMEDTWTINRKSSLTSIDTSLSSASNRPNSKPSSIWSKTCRARKSKENSWKRWPSSCLLSKSLQC